MQALAAAYGTSPTTSPDVSASFALNVAKREAGQEYMAYWNSTQHLTKTRRAVDAVIAPVSPLPAARRGDLAYLGGVSWVNVLDYSSLVVPVGTVDKEVDVVDRSSVPRTNLEKEIWESCEFLYSIQCRRFASSAD